MHKSLCPVLVPASSHVLWEYLLYVHYTKKPTLPPPVVFDSSWHSIESVYKLILDTVLSSANHTAFVPYINYPPHQSTSILCLTAHSSFNPNSPGCFILDNKEAFPKADIVVLGQDTSQKVVMEGIIEVGRDFILYKVKEVGLIPMGGVQITQLVALLNSHPSVHLPLLLLILSCLWEAR